MTEEEYLKEYFNQVDNLTAICKVNSGLASGEHPELEIGSTYQITHIGVLGSSSNIMLSEFPGKTYNANCFDIFENGTPMRHEYTQDPRFWAPYLRKDYRKRNPQWITEHIEDVAKIKDLIEIKKEGKECDTLFVDKGLVEYAQKLADYYNESVGSFRPEQNKVSADALDSILFDMVKNNA